MADDEALEKKTLNKLEEELSKKTNAETIKAKEGEKTTEIGEESAKIKKTIIKEKLKATKKEGSMSNKMKESFPGRVAIAGTKAGWGHVKEGGSVNFFFIIPMAAHILAGYTNYNNAPVRFTMYFALGIISWLTIFKAEEGFTSKQNISAFVYSMGIAGLAWLLPYFFLTFLGPKGFLSIELLNILVSVWPWYLIFFVFIDASTPFLQSLQKILLIIWVVIGIMAVYSAIEAGKLDDIPALKNTINTDLFGAWGNVWRMFWNALKDLFYDVPKMIITSFHRQLEYATGGYYTGKEEQVKERLGVFLNDLKPSDPDIKENESVELWGILEVKSKSEEPFLIEIKCNSSNVTGTHSISQFSVEGNNDIDIDCIFKDGFKKGNHKINMVATYNFETAAYLKIHFINEERKKTMKRAGLDIFEEFGITEKNPVSRYTSGPIKIGMATSLQPIGIDQEAITKPKIGFTIENTWEGKIKNITALKIKLPKGLELDKDTCDYSFTRIETGELTTTYQINEEIGEIKKYRSFNCRTKITNQNALLGNIPLSTKELSVSAEYIFELEEQISISVK